MVMISGSTLGAGFSILGAFFIVPTIAGRDEVATVAAKLVRALSTPFQLGNERVEIGASIGIAIYPGDGADADALISAADAAMYGAKRLGNCYRFASP